MAAGNQYRPDHAVPPGRILEAYMEVRGQTLAEFAQDFGRPPEFVKGLLTGATAIDETTAQRLEELLDMRAYIWLRCEADYRNHLDRVAEAKRVAGSPETADWSKAFPIKELARRGVMQEPESPADAVFRLFHCFDVWTTGDWQVKYGPGSMVYSRRPRNRRETVLLACWRRIGELDAEWQECSDYTAAGFLDALARIRHLVDQPPVAAWPEAVQLCNNAGVVLNLVKPFADLDLRGAAWWLSPQQAIIQLGNYRPDAGSLWGAFFRAAAHLLLHTHPGHSDFFIQPNYDQPNYNQPDGDASDEYAGDERSAGIDAEADRWVANFLAPAATA